MTIKPTLPRVADAFVTSEKLVEVVDPAKGTAGMATLTQVTSGIAEAVASDPALTSQFVALPLADRVDTEVPVWNAGLGVWESGPGGGGPDPVGATAGDVWTADGIGGAQWDPITFDATAVTPALDDYLMGTDTSSADDNAKFLVSAVAELATTPAAAIGYRLPTNAKAATLPRSTPTSNVAVVTLGTQFFVAVELVAGQSLSTISFVSATTALNAGTHQIFTLYSSARALLAQTADDTNTAWAANSVKTLTIASGPYVVPTTGLYYLGIIVAGTTAPSLFCANASGANIVYSIAPALSGFDGTNTGLTTTPPATAAAFTASDRIPYAYVS